MNGNASGNIAQVNLGIVTFFNVPRKTITIQQTSRLVDVLPKDTTIIIKRKIKWHQLTQHLTDSFLFQRERQQSKLENKIEQLLFQNELSPKGFLPRGFSFA